MLVIQLTSQMDISKNTLKKSSFFLLFISFSLISDFFPTPIPLQCVRVCFLVRFVWNHLQPAAVILI